MTPYGSYNYTVGHLTQLTANTYVFTATSFVYTACLVTHIMSVDIPQVKYGKIKIVSILGVMTDANISRIHNRHVFHQFTTMVELTVKTQSNI